MEVVAQIGPKPQSGPKPNTQSLAAGIEGQFRGLQQEAAVQALLEAWLPLRQRTNVALYEEARLARIAVEELKGQRYLQKLADGLGYPKKYVTDLALLRQHLREEEMSSSVSVEGHFTAVGEWHVIWEQDPELAEHDRTAGDWLALFGKRKDAAPSPDDIRAEMRVYYGRAWNVMTLPSRYVECAREKPGSVHPKIVADCEAAVEEKKAKAEEAESQRHRYQTEAVKALLARAKAMAERKPIPCQVHPTYSLKISAVGETEEEVKRDAVRRAKEEIERRGGLDAFRYSVTILPPN